jgi:hypothetical protein
MFFMYLKFDNQILNTFPASLNNFHHFTLMPFIMIFELHLTKIDTKMVSIFIKNLGKICLFYKEHFSVFWQFPQLIIYQKL